MRIKENMFSKKEFMERKKMISLNMEAMIHNEKDFQAKLGLSEYFMKQKEHMGDFASLSLNLSSVKHGQTSHSVLDPSRAVQTRYTERLRSTH
jgi:hypothetical protein